VKRSTWILLVIGAIGIGATAWITAPSASNPQMDQIKASNAVLAGYSERTKQLDLEYKQMLLGDPDFKIYQLCHLAGPTTDEHKAQCARVEDKLKWQLYKAKKNPW
jgi:hypothetical protein